MDLESLWIALQLLVLNDLDGLILSVMDPTSQHRLFIPN